MPFRIKQHLSKTGCASFEDLGHGICKRGIIAQVSNAMQDNFTAKWLQSLNSDRGVSGKGSNKLRKHCLFKTQFETEHYCKIIMSKAHRFAFGKFRLGVAPLRIETDRYEGPIETERICPF